MRFIYYQPNTARGAATRGDCAVRAICKATGQSWDEAFMGLCKAGLQRRDMPNSTGTVRRYLKGLGYRYSKAQGEKTLWELSGEHERLAIVLCRKGKKYHLVTIGGGHYYDSWRSGKMEAIGIFER